MRMIYFNNKTSVSEVGLHDDDHEIRPPGQAQGRLSSFYQSLTHTVLEAHVKNGTEEELVLKGVDSKPIIKLHRSTDDSHDAIKQGE